MTEKRAVIRILALPIGVSSMAATVAPATAATATRDADQHVHRIRFARQLTVTPEGEAQIDVERLVIECA